MPAPTRTARRNWLPAAVLLLSVVPVGAGLHRLATLAGGTEAPETARFFEAPLPLVLHILASLPFLVLGAFQFSARLRRRKPHLHRALGRWLAAAGGVSALTGLWMLFSYPPAPEGDTGMTLFRTALAVIVPVTLFLGLRAIRAGDVPTHRRMMAHAYAAMLTTGTIPFLYIPLVLLAGKGEAPGAGLVSFLALALNHTVAGIATRPRNPRRARLDAVAALPGH